MLLLPEQLLGTHTFCLTPHPDSCVVLAYLLPFFVMLAVMLVGNAIWAVREEILGTVALCAMALYYLVLGMFKDKLQKEFSFTARKK